MPDSPYTPEIFDWNKIYDLLVNQGASVSEAQILAAIAMAESSGYPGAKNDTSIETSYGLFQINLDAHPEVTVEQATTPWAAAQYALQLYRDQGGKPWTMYTNGGYKQYLPTGHPDKQPGPYSGGGIDLEDFAWPSVSDYGGMTTEYLDAVAAIASAFAAAGQALPSGAPSYANAIYQATLNELTTGGQTPEQKAQAQADLATTLQNLRLGEQTYQYNEQINPLLLEELRQKIRRGEALLPLEIQQLEQAIRLAEPVGAESILRTDGGAAGFRDYWSRKGLDSARKDDPDYMAGFNLAKQEGDPERRAALTDYINTVLNTISSQLQGDELETSQAVAEFQRHMDAWREAGQQFESMFQWSIPKGVEYVPGFEPEGFATSIGMQPWKATPVHYDPFQMAQDILNKTPPITSVGVHRPPEIDFSPYEQAQEQLAGFLGEEYM